MKIIKPILLAGLVGSAAFSTAYIIANHSKTVYDDKFDEINKSFETLSNAFDSHKNDHLESDDMEDIYDAIQSNFDILKDSIDDSKNDLVTFFSKSIEDSVDTLNQTILDKESDLNKKIELSSTEIERLTSKFIDIEESQSEVTDQVSELKTLLLESQKKFDEDIKALQDNVLKINDAADLSAEKIEDIYGLIEKINNDFVNIEEVQQSIKQIESKVDSTILYLEDVSKIASDNSYNISELNTQIESLKNATTDLDAKFNDLDTITKENSDKLNVLNDAWTTLDLYTRTNITKINDSILELKTSITDLSNLHEGDMKSVNASIEDLRIKYNNIFQDNEELKSDIAGLHLSISEIFKGLLELEDGYNDLEDKYNNTPALVVMDDQYRITGNSSLEIPLPNLKELKSMSMFLKISRPHESETINVNLLNVFYTTEGTFTGNVSLETGENYLIKAKFNADSIEVLGLWYRGYIGPWRMIRNNAPNQYVISKIVATY